jgi:sugar/nucleoside kinase (ribokinase family)
LFLGLATVDIIYAIEGSPAPNSKNVAARQELYAGGPAANAAATFAALRGNATLAAIAGRHPLTALIRDDLEACAVSICDLAPGFQQPPSCSSILVNPSNGTRIVVSANATRLPPPEIAPPSPAGFEIVLVDGHLMETSIELARLARSKGIPVILDGGSWKQGTAQLLDVVDIAIVSEDFHPPRTSTPQETLAYLVERSIPSCAITQGAKPILFSNNGHAGEIKIPRIRVIDTLGAGDIFHGAFCHHYAATKTGFAAALEFGAEIASFSCQFFGPREWMGEFTRSR